MHLLPEAALPRIGPHLKLISQCYLFHISLVNQYDSGDDKISSAQIREVGDVLRLLSTDPDAERAGSHRPVFMLAARGREIDRTATRT